MPYKNPADDRAMRKRLRQANPERYNEIRRNWRNRNKEKARASARARYQHRKDFHRERQLKANFGLTNSEYEAMFSSQNGLCAICGGAGSTLRKLSVDHSHDTGRIRGLLCNPCNLMLGLFERIPDAGLRVAGYLEAHRAKD